MAEPLLPLERAVLDFALVGEHPTLDILREQAKSVTVVTREFTGVGFFTRLAVDAAKPAIDGRPGLAIADIDGEAADLAHGLGFVVFVEEGFLAFIEGFTIDEPWPAGLSDVALSYSTSVSSDVPTFPRPKR